MERTSIIGNLTADPEMRTTQNGYSVCSFTVAVNRRPTKAQREAGQQPPAKFYRVSAWYELGENCAKYLSKGRKVLVEGTIDANAYISQKDGQAHASLELTAKEVEFLSSNSGGQAQQAAPEPAAQMPDEAAGYTPVDPEDLPF